jgi:hypothetical protein
MFALSPNCLLFVSAKLSRLVVVAHPMWGDWLKADFRGDAPDTWHRRLTPQAFVWLRVSIGAAEERRILAGDALAAAWATLTAIERDGLATGQLTRDAIAFDSALPGDWGWWDGCPQEAADWASGTLLTPAQQISQPRHRRPADATPAAPAKAAEHSQPDLFSALD